MSIPFNKIGPSQLARTVVQILGKDGPIFNPKNISYLSPEDVSSEILDLPFGQELGVSGLTLASSLVSLGIQAQTLDECRKITAGLKKVQESQERIEKVLSDIKHRVDRIDTKVAESHLREAIRHAMSKSCHPDHIDLQALTPLGEDLESFAETLDEGLLFNFGVRLTSDVREQLQSMLSVLRNARKAVVISHNRAVLGDPDKIVLFRRASDYLPAAAHTIISLSLALGRSDKAFHNLVEKVVSDVSSRFFFSDEKDADHFADLTYKEGYSAQYAALHSVPVSSAAASLSAVLDNLEVNYDNEEAVLDCAESIFEAWIGSDSYLIHALTYELQGITSGYASVFYQQLLGGELADASPLLLPMTSKSS
jgi:hypothetical protein